MMYISNLVIPLIILIIISFGLFEKIDLYDTFLEGVQEGLKMAIKIFPTILAMIVSINVLLKSNIVNDLVKYIEPFLEILKFPKEVLPLAIMRPISGSSSLVLMNELFVAHGPDSFIGRVASVLQGSNDTTIYIIGLYFGSIGIKKIRYAMKVGLLADLISVLLAVVMVSIFF